MTKIKICGLTNKEDAVCAESLGADYVGFVFFKNSPRCVSVENAAGIISCLKKESKTVGLFCNQEINFVTSAVEYLKLDIVQIHGDESCDFVDELRNKFSSLPEGSSGGINIIKSFKIAKNFNFDTLTPYKAPDFYLFDTYKKGMPGGTGEVFDWKMLKGRSFNKPFFLAGGLNPSNVKNAISIANPYAVDVASGIEEKPGKKDYKLMEGFINAAR